jgi:hypothetical protein
MTDCAGVADWLRLRAGRHQQHQRHREESHAEPPF